MIVARWLLQNPGRLADWAMADHDKRDFLIGKVIHEPGGETDAEMRETVEALEGQRGELVATRERWVEEQGEPTGGIPSVETMATQIGAGFAYQLAYRVQSQSDVHATPLAADVCYDQAVDGTLRLRKIPAHALGEFDQYELGAHALRDLLATVNAHLPGFMWATGLAGITAALEAARESDPRKHEDPVANVADAHEGT